MRGDGGGGDGPHGVPGAAPAPRTDAGRALAAACRVSILTLTIFSHQTTYNSSEYGGNTPPEGRTHVPAGGPRAPSDTLARRVLKHEMRLNLPASPGQTNVLTKSISQWETSSEDRRTLQTHHKTIHSYSGKLFNLGNKKLSKISLLISIPLDSSPRGEVAAAYLNKLELVSRCLNHAMEASRDVP
ncbi:hypothetical protein HF086_011891 [Spodoptera exigua]|uniref:Uncharacterized protein n=1 Tax=Spodoptera exigua TaxID=7107 RepID=A0A922M9B4_SPOEX|nr:hypothetical protein HF086_011891 [Spodoptera exigua]